MNIKIIAVGKIKEKYMQDAIKEFQKRLSCFCSLSIVEIQAEKILSDALIEKYKDIESEKILEQIKPNSFVISLEIKGKSFTSEVFAEKISDISKEGYNEIVFIIGGANGFNHKVSGIANLKLSFSSFTFPHQLMRIFLLEQIYRAFKILNNEQYHR